MGKAFEGKLDGKGLRVGIVVSRFNSLITERLLEGAMDRLTCSNVKSEAIEREGSKAGNKGSEAAESLIEMVNVLREIK